MKKWQLCLRSGAGQSRQIQYGGALEQANKKTKDENKKKTLAATGSLDCQRNMGQAAASAMPLTFKNWQDGREHKTRSHGGKAPS